MVDAATALPTTDELLEAPQGKQTDSSSLPTTDSLLGGNDNKPPSFLAPVMSAARMVMDVKQVQGAFMEGMKSQYLDPKYGLSSKDEEHMRQNENNWYEKVGGAFVSSAATALDFATRPIFGTMAGIPLAARKAGTIIGGEQFGKEAEFLTRAIPENFPLGVHATLGIPEPPLFQKAIANHAIGTDEVFLNPAKATPEQEAAAQSAATESPLVTAGSPWNQPVATQEAPLPAPTIHDVVRQDNPALFNEYDRLVSQRDTYGQWNRELAAQRQAQAEKNSPYNQEIEDLQQQMAGGSKRQQKIVQEKLDAVMEKHDAWVQEEASKVTPDMQQVQSAYMQADNRLREIAGSGQISAAYKAAAEKMPSEVMPEEAPIAKAQEETKPFVSPWGEAKEEAPPAPPEKSLEEQRVNIVNDIVKKAVASGYNKEHAESGAQILARMYQYLADAYGGAKGNALALYEKEGPEITNLTAKAQANELTQGAKGSYAPASEGVRGIIRMFKSSDASTLIHEGAHHFLNMLKRYEGLEDAPAKLKEDMNVVRNWLGVKEDGVFTSRHEEKFARGWERYVMEGHAPTKPLIAIFQKFEKWLTDIYGTIKKIPHGELSDAVRNFFDRVIEPNAELRNNPRNTVVAPEHEPGKAIADIHEVDAEQTPPQEAERVGDNIEKEMDNTAKLHNPEIADAIQSAEQATGIPETPASNTATRTAAESIAGGSGTPEESGTVTGGGNAPQAEGAAARAESAAAGDKRPDNPHRPLPKSGTSFVDKAGNVRLENLTNELDIRDAIRELWQTNPEIMNAATRGTVSDQMVSDYADSLGIEDKDINIQKLRDMSVNDGIPMAARILAGRRVLRGSALNIKELWGKMADGNEASILEYALARERHLMIAETVSGITAEWGRAGRAFQDISSAEMGEAGNITELLQRSLGTTPEKLVEEAKAGMSLKTEAQIAKFLKKTVEPDFWDKMIEYRNNCLLSGPITHTHYIEGGFINALYTPIIQVPAGVAAQRIAEVAGKEIAPEQRIHLGESGAMLYAMQSGSVRGWRAAVHAWESGRQITLPGEKTYGTTKGNVTPIEPQRTAIGGVLGRAVNTPGRIINSIHAFQKTLRFEQNIAGLAYRQAMNEGLDAASPEFSRRVAHLVDNPTSEMMDKATKDAIKQVYMEKVSSQGFVGKQMLAAQSTKLGRYLFPFVKIEYNIKRQAFLDNTAFGLFSKDIRDNISGVHGADVQAMQIGKMVAGTAIAGVAGALASTGRITANGPTNPAERKVWLLTHVPNSITIAGAALPIRMLGTFGQIMSLGANIHEVVDGTSEEDAYKLAVSFAEHTSRMAFDNGFMQNAKNTLDVCFDSTEHADKFVRDSLLQWIPGEVGLGQVAAQIDPTLRETNNLIDAARAKIPFASYGLTPKFDMFGNPIKRGATYDQYKDDPIVKKLQELHIGVGVLHPDILGQKLDPQQWGEYQQLAGQLVNDRLRDVIGGVNFESQTPAMQRILVHRAITQGREAAKNTIKLENPWLVQEALDNKRALLYGQ